MNDYKKLVKALRCKGLSKECDSCGYGYHISPDSECNDACDNERLEKDAAAAIEALQAQLPKRGEIVRCGECKWYGIYYAKKDGTPDKRYNKSVCLRGIYAKRRDPDWFCADGERKVQE